MFLLKKTLAPFFLPVALCLEFLALGLVLLWFTRKQRAAKALLTAGALLLAAFSHSGLADALLAPLEYRYPALLDPARPAEGGAPPVRWILVLGGGHAFDPELPVTSRLTGSSLVRLIEGIRIHRRLPGSKLILFGGRIYGPVSEAESMAELAAELGVDANDIVLESSSWDTKDQAAIAPRLVGEERFILVTSAAHMPRAVALFRKQGLRPIPAPTGHWSSPHPSLGLAGFFPTASVLWRSERALHEYLGSAWAWLRGQADLF